LQISFLTVHKSKGLEADNIIVLNMKNEVLGFPNKIADDPLLNYVLSSKDKYPYAEERRLLYVALTRTKNTAYLLAPTSNPSEFISELAPMCLITSDCIKEFIQNNPSCPKCQTGHLVIRKNESNNNNFVGCTHYPACNYTNKNLSIISNPIKCPSCGGYLVERNGAYGKFYACSNYPLCYYKINSNEKQYSIR